MPETSVLVPGVLTWHPHHVASRAEIQTRLAAGQQMLLAAPALVETYSVLTRLPPPRRLAAHRVVELMAANYLDHGTVVAMDPGEYPAFFRLLASTHVAGGRAYDAVIAATSRSAGAAVLLTFNARHFVGLIDDLDVVVPSA